MMQTAQPAEMLPVANTNLRVKTSHDAQPAEMPPDIL